MNYLKFSVGIHAFVQRSHKKELLTKNNICFLEIAPHQDVIFAFKALYLAETIVSVPEAKYFWRTNINSTTQKAQKKSVPDDAIFEMISALRNECKYLNVSHEWVLAADRLIESHINLMIKNISRDNISSYLRNAHYSSGNLPYSVFNKLKVKLNKEVIGNDTYEYYVAQKRFSSASTLRENKYRKLSIQLGITLSTIILLNLLLIVLLIV